MRVLLPKDEAISIGIPIEIASSSPTPSGLPRNDRHASLMLKQGIPPKVVQERLGHASIQITLDAYSHVAPGLQEAAAKGFDEEVFPRYNGTGAKEPVASH